MKKVMISLLVLVVSILLVGCLDYKAYDVPVEENSGDSLVNEIAQIEEELNTGDEPTTNETEEVTEEVSEEPQEEEVVEEEEVVLPDFDEEETVPEGDLKTITVKENEPINLNVKVSDPDNDEVTYTFSQPLNSKGQWNTNYGDAGEYLVTIAATDGALTTEKKVKIVVKRVNVAPKVTGIKDITVNEGQTVDFEPTVSDPNNDPVNVEVAEPLKSGTFVTDHTSAGEYDIKVSASDGELETVKTFKLTINDVNVLPEISAIEDITIEEGETVEITPEVSDLDAEDELTVTISDPVKDGGVWETDFTDHGVYFVTVSVNDGEDTVTEKIKVTVEDVNMPPEIVDVNLEVDNE